MNLNKIFLHLMFLPMSGYMRGKMARWGGVNAKKKVFVGEGVQFDTVNPGGINIGSGTTIATGAVILTHYIDLTRPAPGFKFTCGSVNIGNNCFIGAKVVISNSVSIGDDSIVAAGSVVTHDIPSGQIWGGVPAKFIKNR